MNQTNSISQQTENQPHAVTKEDSFECAIRLIDEGFNPVVLDFASGTNPGGNWRGNVVGTQEESLCRRSNLGLLLEKKKYPIPMNSLYYIKNVIITKNLNMENIDPIKVSVIASELKNITDSTINYLNKRICDFYETAIQNKHDCIILGAIGCGAFKESDDDVIILSKQMRICADLYKDKILTVFAIYNNKNNFLAFKKAMS